MFSRRFIQLLPRHLRDISVKSSNILSKKQSILPSIRHSISDAATTVQKHVSPRSQKIVGAWLLGCAGMCYGAVAIGGITRLTESGLSMTKWHILKDMKPPTTDAEWEAEFERYKTFPEYKYVHRELTVEQFKAIFFWEYIHRMWGRAVGLVFLLPAAYFWKKGWVTKALKPRLIVYGSFIVFQGLLGWYMVKSGLAEKPDSTEIPRVSQYRLAAHLGSALLLYTLFLWQGLSHTLSPNMLVHTQQTARLGKFSHAMMAMVFFTAVSGAFVAGLDAGLTYNTWPKFADRWIPSDLFALSPKWKNVFENATTVQFNHRHLGETTGTLCLLLGGLTLISKVPRRTRNAGLALGIVAVCQITLGILTLLKQVPITLAASHQSGSVVLLSCAVWLAHEFRKLPK